jgi:hypothetical protein
MPYQKTEFTKEKQDWFTYIISFGCENIVGNDVS